MVPRTVVLGVLYPPLDIQSVSPVDVTPNGPYRQRLGLHQVRVQAFRATMWSEHTTFFLCVHCSPN